MTGQLTPRRPSVLGIRRAGDAVEFGQNVIRHDKGTEPVERPTGCSRLTAEVTVSGTGGCLACRRALMRFAALPGRGAVARG